MTHVVLIVEDSEQCSVTLETALLGLDGIQVERLSNARDALRFLRSSDAPSVSAVITDLHLPAMDGFELIRRIREDNRLARLPIVVCTADPDPATPERAASLGVDAFFPKPFKPSEVRSKVEQLVHASRNASS